jgi:alkylhydroperoxidase family enzyme
MNRVPREKLSPEQQAGWDHSKAICEDATILEVLANSPKVSKMFSKHFYQELFFDGDVPRRYKELVRYRLSLIHGCHFCNLNNRASSKEAGLTEAELDAMEDFENGPFTDADKAAIALAEQLALTNFEGALTPELYSRLTAHFSDGDIVELAMVGAILGGMNKMAFVLNLVAKEEYCPFAPQVAA